MAGTVREELPIQHTHHGLVSFTRRPLTREQCFHSIAKLRGTHHPSRMSTGSASPEKHLGVKMHHQFVMKVTTDSYCVRPLCGRSSGYRVDCATFDHSDSHYRAACSNTGRRSSGIEELPPKAGLVITF